ncbi:Gustatory receptor 105e, partial [Halyomorpha halys]
MEDSVLSDIFNVSRVLGLFPLDGKFLLSKKWLVYTTLFQLLNVMVGFSTATMKIRFSIGIEIRYFRIFLLIDGFDRVFSHFRQIFTVVYIVRKRNSILELFNSINQIVTRHGNSLNYRFRFTRYCLFFCFILELSPLLFGRNHYNSYIFINSFILFVNFSSTASIVGQIWDLMSVLTKLVHTNTSECDESCIDALKHLSTIGEFIDEIYGPLLLIVIVSCFPRMIMDLYAILMQIFPHMLTLNILMLLSALMGSFFVSSIAYSINKFLNQIDEFNNKLLWKMLNDKTGRYIENEKFNFHFTAYKAIKFTACGFFNMDYSLISSMISVCTTYLVIVLQYGKSS